jgi:hypothetical protein
MLEKVVSEWNNTSPGSAPESHAPRPGMKDSGGLRIPGQQQVDLSDLFCTALLQDNTP